MKDISSIAFLGRGFRPFFLFGALFAVLSMFIWGGFNVGYWDTPVFADDAILWHAHEMIFGYTIAIISGFLLTAVANWTGGAPVRQWHLLGLLLLWLIGRVVINFDTGLPIGAVQILALSFLPALAISLAIPLINNWNKRNFVFLALLTILFSLDAWVFLSVDKLPLYLAVFVIMIMISLIGGRIIPAFTVAALRQSGEKVFQIDQPKIDILALVSLLLLIISFVVDIQIAIAVTALFSASVHLFRMRNYHTKLVFKDPMLWILHVGYFWLVIGLVLIGLSGLEILPVSTALHALTAGAIGSMTLGMMTRVAMGHTGREIKANILTIIAFISMQGVAISRVFMPLIMLEHTSLFMVLSSVLWVLSFLIYLIVYAPMLCKSRPDGRPA